MDDSLIDSLTSILVGIPKCKGEMTGIFPFGEIGLAPIIKNWSNTLKIRQFKTSLYFKAKDFQKNTLEKEYPGRFQSLFTDQASHLAYSSFGIKGSEYVPSLNLTSTRCPKMKIHSSTWNPISKISGCSPHTFEITNYPKTLPLLSTSAFP